MRFMVLVRSNAKIEGGAMPTEAQLREMSAFNEELSKAGMLLAGEGLHPSSKGARIKFTGSKPSVTDGPFAETKELVAGFWLLQAKSKQEVVEWISRAPFQAGDEVEIRQLFEAEDFGDALTPEIRAQEERLRAQTTPR
jgi:hypothetical protein